MTAVNHVDLWIRQLEAAGLADRTIGLRVTTLASFYEYVFNGLRIAEACGIDIEHQGMAGFYPQLEVLRKGGARQKITLARPTEAAVAAAVGGRTSGPLLLNQAGNRMTQRNAQLIIDKCVPRVPEGVRGDAAVVTADSGGWTGLAMVSYYAHGQDDPARSVTHAVAGVVLSS